MGYCLRVNAQASHLLDDALVIGSIQCMRKESLRYSLRGELLRIIANWCWLRFL